MEQTTYMKISVTVQRNDGERVGTKLQFYDLILDEAIDFPNLTVQAGTKAHFKLVELVDGINVKVTLQRELQDEMKKLFVYRLKDDMPKAIEEY
jgi:hypothetical protein